MITRENLKQIVMLTYLTDDMLDELIPITELLQYDEKEYVFYQGDKADRYYSILRELTRMEVPLQKVHRIEAARGPAGVDVGVAARDVAVATRRWWRRQPPACAVPGRHLSCTATVGAPVGFEPPEARLRPSRICPPTLARAHRSPAAGRRKPVRLATSVPTVAPRDSWLHRLRAALRSRRSMPVCAVSLPAEVSTAARAVRPPRGCARAGSSRAGTRASAGSRSAAAAAAGRHRRHTRAPR